jgi:hypothetical protein
LCSGILDVYTAMLDVYPRCLSPLGVEKKKKELLELLRANLRNSMRAGRRLAELRWTPVDARDRAGPATLDSHGGDATRRLGVSGP